MRKSIISALIAGLSLTGIVQAADLTIYSGRGESFVAPLVQQFEQNTGLKVTVRYGDTAQLASLILEEGQRSPADIYWGQDAGAMGSLAYAGVLAELPESLFTDIPEIFSSQNRQWVATSGRSRVLVHSTERVDQSEMPSSVFDLTDEKYKGRVGWAPTNGGFQAFVTAMRVTHGEETTEQWLRDMAANQPVVFRNNTTIVEGVGNGDADFGLVNNYYLPRFIARNADFPARQTFFANGDIGNLLNVAGVGILERSNNQEAALKFVEFLVSPAAQQYFTSVVNEHPISNQVIANPVLGNTDTLLGASPEVNLDDLYDLPGTLELLRKVGLI